MTEQVHPQSNCNYRDSPHLFCGLDHYVNTNWQYGPVRPKDREIVLPKVAANQA